MSLEELLEKYSDIITDAESLAEPLRSIALFVQKEGGKENA
jgi:hypothetical protein